MGHEPYMREMRNSYKILVEILEKQILNKIPGLPLPVE
jgi:hypothetical protein